MSLKTYFRCIAGSEIPAEIAIEKKRFMWFGRKKVLNKNVEFSYDNPLYSEWNRNGTTGTGTRGPITAISSSTAIGVSKPNREPEDAGLPSKQAQAVAKERKGKKFIEFLSRKKLDADKRSNSGCVREARDSSSKKAMTISRNQQEHGISCCANRPITPEENTPRGKSCSPLKTKSKHMVETNLTLLKDIMSQTPTSSTLSSNNSINENEDNGFLEPDEGTIVRECGSAQQATLHQYLDEEKNLLLTTGYENHLAKKQASVGDILAQVNPTLSSIVIKQLISARKSTRELENDGERHDAEIMQESSSRIRPSVAENAMKKRGGAIANVLNSTEQSPNLKTLDSAINCKDTTNMQKSTACDNDGRNQPKRRRYGRFEVFPVEEETKIPVETTREKKTFKECGGRKVLNKRAVLSYDNPLYSEWHQHGKTDTSISVPIVAVSPSIVITTQRTGASKTNRKPENAEAPVEITMLKKELKCFGRKQKLNTAVSSKCNKKSHKENDQNMLDVEQTVCEAYKASKMPTKSVGNEFSSKDTKKKKKSRLTRIWHWFRKKLQSSNQRENASHQSVVM